MPRLHDRSPDELRPIHITSDFLTHAEGSVLIEVGQTRVICAASIEERVPPFLQGTGRGWVTGEYAMMPGSVPDRIAPARNSSGRAEEIARLIGRSLRAAMD